MSRNGSGTYSLPSNSWNPATNGTPATAADWQTLINDVAAALTQSLSKDGQTPLTGNLAAGGNKVTGLAAGASTGDSLRFEQLFSQGALTDIASSTTTDIGAQLSTMLRVTGTTTITGFGTNYNGPRFLIFVGAVTLTHSATLVLPGAANITTAANDALIALPISGGWQVVAYQRASGDIDAKSINGGPLAGLRNLLINGNFAINQRAYVSGAAVGAANTYTLDRWRVVTSGQSLTFSTSGNGKSVTAPAGGVEQVIEGLSIAGGSYVLNWTGTATATVDGTARTKGEVFTLTAGANVTVRFTSGTVSVAQLEPGTIATPFEPRPYGLEFALCLRYFTTSTQGITALSPYTPASSLTDMLVNIQFPVVMRTTPTVTLGTQTPGGGVATSISIYGFRYGGITGAVNTVYSASGFSASAEL